MGDYWGHTSRWLVVKCYGGWAVCPPRQIAAAFYDTWREAMDHVIREAGL